MSQLSELKLLIEPELLPDDELLYSLLETAKQTILNRRYPYSEPPVDVYGQPILENRYLALQIRIAIYLFNKLGVEGELSHSESGVNRVYESVDIPMSMLKEVIPFVGGF